MNMFLDSPEEIITENFIGASFRKIKDWNDNFNAGFSISSMVSTMRRFDSYGAFEYGVTEEFTSGITMGRMATFALRKDPMLKEVKKLRENNLRYISSPAGKEWIERKFPDEHKDLTKWIKVGLVKVIKKREQATAAELKRRGK